MKKNLLSLKKMFLLPTAVAFTFISAAATVNAEEISTCQAYKCLPLVATTTIEGDYVDPETMPISLETQIHMHRRIADMLQMVLDSGNYELIESFTVYPGGEHRYGPELYPITIEDHIRLHNRMAYIFQTILDSGDYEVIESHTLSPEDTFPLSFVSSDFVTSGGKVVFEDLGLEVIEAYRDPRLTLTVINNNTHFRATCNGTSLGQVHAGTRVTWLAMVPCAADNNVWWDQVRILDGQNAGRTGWISSDMLR